MWLQLGQFKALNNLKNKVVVSMTMCVKNKEKDKCIFKFMHALLYNTIFVFMLVSYSMFVNFYTGWL